MPRPKKELRNYRVGSLTYIKPVGQDSHQAVLWECKCDCGNIRIATSSERRRIKSCGQECPIYSKSHYARINGMYPCDIHGLTKPQKFLKYFRCGKCRNGDKRDKYRAVKQKAVEYLGGCCVRCQYNECNAALDFHHLDPSEKDFSFAGSHKLWETVKPELDKCILLCSNCHREYHAGEWEITDVRTNG
jgi:hypothetical protein